MATTITISPVAYNGEASQQYLLKCMAGGKTAAAGVRFLDSVKFKINLKKLDATNLLVPATCDYSPNGTIVASADQYEVKEVQSEVQICWADLVQLFGSENLSAGVENGNVNQITDFSTSLIEIMTSKIAESVDNMLWNSVATSGTSVNDMFDGYLHILDNHGGLKVTGTTGATNASTIIAKFYAVLGQAPSCVSSKNPSELVFFTNGKTRALLQQAYSAFQNITPVGTIASTFMGIDVVMIPALPDGVIIFGERKNFVIMTDLYSDFNSVTVLDERPKYNYVVFILRGKLVAGIGFPEEVTVLGL